MFGFIKRLFVPAYDNSFYPYLLRKPALSVFVVAILGFNIFASAFSTSVSAGDITPDSIVALTNNERAGEGLGSLSIDPRLSAAAEAKAADIFANQYWSHYGPAGQTPWDFILASGYDYVYAGENLAKGFTDAESVVSAWMASKSHRENILGANYVNIGVAVVSGNLLGSDVILVVQMFGALGFQEAPLPETSNYFEPEPAASVEITFPEDGLITADNQLGIRGSSSAGIAEVNINSDGESLGESICNEGVWDYRPSARWTEGSHLVSVSSTDSTRPASDSVEFTVDTVAPVIDEDSVIVRNIDTKAQVGVRVSGEPRRVSVYSGDFEQEMAMVGEGYFTTEIYPDDLQANVGTQIVAMDAAGNYAVYDISRDVLGEESEVNIPVSIGGLGSSDLSSTFNVVVVVFMIALLLFDAYYLVKLNILSTRGKTLFPLAVLVLILGVRIISGTGGVIS